MSSDTAADLADRIAETVLAISGVNALHAGVLGEAATYLPGRRVNGVKLAEDACEVHVVLDWGTSIPQTADAVRAAVEPLVEGPVHVAVEDVATAESSGPAPEISTDHDTKDRS